MRSAQNALAQDCVAKFDLRYIPDTPQASGGDASDRRYGLSSAGDAARYGYHLPPEPSAGKSQSVGPALRLVLTGAAASGEKTHSEYQGREVPENGCLGEAARKLGEGHDDPADAQVAGSIADGSFKESMADRRVRTVFARWSACMTERGYMYATPLAAIGDKAFLEEEAAGPREVATAEADMRCKQRTGLLNTWFSVESRIQSAMIAKNGPALHRLRSAHAGKVAEAERILAARS